MNTLKYNFESDYVGSTAEKSDAEYNGSNPIPAEDPFFKEQRLKRAKEMRAIGISEWDLKRWGLLDKKNICHIQIHDTIV